MIDRLIERFNRQIPNPRFQSIILHFLFWLVWLSRSFYDVIGAFGLKWSFVYIGVILISQAPMVYIHLYALVPRLLNRKRYFIYIVLTAALVFSYSWFHYQLITSLPRETMSESMLRFAERITPEFDLLEGLIVIILTYALKYTLIAFITQNELLRLQKEKLQLELNALKGQIHPHFLFNTLNNIYSLTLKNSSQASESILKLSDIMRYVLYQANQDKVALSNEIDFIRNYVELQRIRYSQRYDIRLDVNGDPEGRMVSPLLFIDFTENAFKHGIDKRFSDGWVHITFDIGKEEIRFNASNSIGQEADQNENRSDSGIGLKNIKKRLDILYPGKHQLEITRNDESYGVELILQPT
jgi:sensor histidine kinase YesM